MHKIRDFNDDRASLSHNLIKNKFLVSIAYSPENKDSQDRYIKFLEALQGNESRKIQVLAAFKEWPELRRNIEDFLSHISQRYGYVLSEEFKIEKESVFLELTNVSDFIDRFENGELSDKELPAFWESMDQVTEFFGHLGTEQKRYFIDIDPFLIKE